MSTMKARDASVKRHGPERPHTAPTRSTFIWTRPVAFKGPTADDFVSLYKKDPIEQVELVKRGIAASLIEHLAGGMGVSREKLLKTLGLPRATIQRRAKAQQSLTADESSKVLGISRLIGQAQAMVDTSGDPKGFDAAAWIAQWLDQPLAALGGQRPAELMDTAEGQVIVSNILSRAQSGAYA